MTILSCNNNICKTITIPSPSNTTDVPNITVTVDIPEGLRIDTVAVNYGSVTENVWTITSLPAGESATLNICFTTINCDTIPTGKSGNITIATTLPENNITNNVKLYTLDYITCEEVNGCTGLFRGTFAANPTGTGKVTIPHTLGVVPVFATALRNTTGTAPTNVFFAWVSNETTDTNLVFEVYNGTDGSVYTNNSPAFLVSVLAVT